MSTISLDRERPFKPLDSADEENRGNTILTLEPPDGTNMDGPDSSIIDVDSRCSRGELMTVTLGIKPNDRVDTTRDAFVYTGVRALIQWGIGGTHFEALLDFLHGAQLSIAAENIRVAARYIKRSRPWNPDVDEEAPSYQVSAGLSYGANSRNSNGARLTELIQLETAASTQDVEIPPYATALTILPVNGAQINASVFGRGTAYNVDYQARSPVTNVNQYNVENTFPLFNGSRFVRLSNATGDEEVFGFLIFDLDL